MLKEIIGCILIGGKSTRMGGGIKSLKHFNNKSIIERIIEKSKKQVSELIINSNNDLDLKKYSLPIFSDFIKGYLGPLAGIHASMNWIKKNKPNNKWLMTFAGDTPFFPDNIVEKLFNEANKKNKKIILAESNKRNHPVFGIWHTSLEEELKNSIIKHNARKIDEWAKKYSYGLINFSNENYDPFFNINKPSDLIKAEKIENQFLNR